MKVGNFEILVRTTQGSPLPELSHGPETYVVARSGSAFTVHVKRGEDDDGHTPCVKVLLKVDGKCPGHAKRLKLGSEATFMGWLQEDIQRGEESADIADFVLQATKAEPSLGSTQDPGSLPSGKIVLGFWNAELQEENVAQEMAAAVSGDVQQPEVAEGQKWFKAPSLATQPGTKRRRAMSFDPRGKWQQTSLICEVVLCYETASTLIMREVLKPADNPRHMAIVNSHGDSVAKHLAQCAVIKKEPGAAEAKAKGKSKAGKAKRSMGPPSSTLGTAGTAGAAGAATQGTAAGAGTQEGQGSENLAPEGSQAGGSTQQTAVKQEGAGGSRSKRAKGTEGVDVCTQPMEVDGSVVQPDEFALCDLSQADNVPGWSVHKRPAEPVEELDV